MNLSVITDELDMDVKEAIPIIQSWGCNHVDLRNRINGKSIEEQTEDELKELKKFLNDNSISIGSILSSVAKVNLPDKERQKLEEVKMDALVKACSILECKRVSIFNYWIHEAKDTEWGKLASDNNLDKVLNMMEPILQKARDAGLELSFENCCQSAEEVLALIKAINEPAWGLCFDPFYEGAFRDIDLKTSKDWYVKTIMASNIVHVHGTSVGTLPWDSLLKGISAAGKEILVSIKTQHVPEGRSTTFVEASRRAYTRIKKDMPSEAPQNIQDALEPVRKFPRTYNDNPVTFVVVGLGMGRTRARQLTQTEGCKLYGVVDINAERAETVGKEFGVPYSTDIDTFLNDPKVEVMYTMVPTGLHTEVSVKCLSAGKHVLTTKPMERNVAECRRLIQIAKENNKILGLDFDLRQNETLLSLKKAIDSGYFGKLLHMTATLNAKRDMVYYKTNGGWRGTWRYDGGGSMCNQGVHEIDRVQFILGMPKRVKATTATMTHEIECEDIGDSIWEYEDGLKVIYSSTTNHPLTTWYIRLELYGTEGAYIFTGGGPEGESEWYGKDNRWTNTAPYPVEREFQQGSDAFAYAIRMGTPLATPGEEGLYSRILLDAMYQSSKNDSAWIDIASI